MINFASYYFFNTLKVYFNLILIEIVNFYHRLFDKYPDYVSKFNNLKNLSPDELKTSTNLKAHATRVMYLLGAMVDNLDDLDVVVEMATKMGRDHKPRAITHQMLSSLGELLICTFTEELGADVMNDTTSKAWTTVYNLIIDTAKSDLE